MSRILLVEFDGRHGHLRGTHRITIPDSAKVTFSGVNPSSGPHSEKALRIYEGRDRQLACFVGVASFRDLSSVKVERQRRDIKVSHEEESKRGGKRTEHAVQFGPGEWVDVLELGPDSEEF